MKNRYHFFVACLVIVIAVVGVVTACYMKWGQIENNKEEKRVYTSSFDRAPIVTISLLDGRFSLVDTLSSELQNGISGSYIEEGNELILMTDDKEYVLYFEIDGKELLYNKDKSSIGRDLDSRIVKLLESGEKLQLKMIVAKEQNQHTH